MNLRSSLAVLFALLPVGLLACGGPGNPGKGAVDASALGKNKCVTDGDEHRLFIVDWDATDLASFESRAGRDLVLVKYEGCKVTILNGCSDEGIAGRYGTYRKPIPTSGTVESLSVTSNDELYAKLPLGAAKFGAEVSRGRALDMAYFVSGTVDSTRDSVYRGDIAQNARCKEATHFVSSYALGAFTLGSLDKASAGAKAEGAGLGAGAKSESEAKSLKKAGDMDACKSLDTSACRAPIRLTLRPISTGDRPDGPAAGPVPSAAGPLGDAQAMMDGVQLRASAEQKLMAGDGAGCLADLDRLNATKKDMVDPQTNILRAKCEMRAGKCDDGKKHYKEAKSAWTKQMEKGGAKTNATDASVAAEADEMAKQFCPSAGTGGAPAGQALLTSVQKIQQAAAAKDAATCIKEAAALEKAAAASGGDMMSRMAAMGGLRAAAVCAGEGKKCADAERLFKASVAAQGITDPQMVKAAFKDAVPACAK